MKVIFCLNIITAVELFKRAYWSRQWVCYFCWNSGKLGLLGGWHMFIHVLGLQSPSTLGEFSWVSEGQANRQWRRIWEEFRGLAFILDAWEPFLLPVLTSRHTFLKTALKIKCLSESPVDLVIGVTNLAVWAISPMVPQRLNQERKCMHVCVFFQWKTQCWPKTEFPVVQY
jgi:hypothetical protein